MRCIRAVSVFAAMAGLALTATACTSGGTTVKLRSLVGGEAGLSDGDGKEMARFRCR